MLDGAFTLFPEAEVWVKHLLLGCGDQSLLPPKEEEKHVGEGDGGSWVGAV